MKPPINGSEHNDFICQVEIGSDFLGWIDALIIPALLREYWAVQGVNGRQPLEQSRF